MATIFDESIRIPFKIYEIGEKSILIPKELYMNFDTGVMYIKTESGNDIEAGKETINRVINYELDKLISGADDNANTLKKLQDLLKPLVNWKNQMTIINDTPFIDTVAEILDKFSDMEETAPTILAQLKLKVLTEPSKGLSDEDFIDELYNKLLEIEKNANNYSHPENKICNFEELVKSINGETGDVIITKEHLGLGEVEEAANYYIHPTQQQCNAVGIDSCNDKTGVVTISKKDLELGNIQNLSLLQDSEIDSLIDGSMTEVKYMTPKQLHDAMVKMKNNGQMVNPFIPKITTLTINPTPSDAEVKIYYKGKWYIGKTLQVDMGSYYIVNASKANHITKQETDIVNAENPIKTIKLIKLIKINFTINNRTYDNSNEIFKLVASSNNYYSEGTHAFFEGYEWNGNVHAGYADYTFMCMFDLNGQGYGYRQDLATIDSTLDEINVNFDIPANHIPFAYEITSFINPKTNEKAQYLYSDDNIHWQYLNERGTLPIGNYKLEGRCNGYKNWGPIDFTISDKSLNIIKADENWIEVHLIKINPTPSDATVEIYYNDQWNRVNTATVVDGTYKYRVSKDGYATKIEDIIVNGNDMTIDVTLMKKYSVTINSVPSSAGTDFFIWYNDQWTRGKYASLPNGTYQYMIHGGWDYEVKEGTFTINNEDIVVNGEMVPRND